MKKILHTLSILLVIMISLSCAKDKICTTSDPCAPTMRYFPLAVGNYWIYEIIRYNPVTYTGTVLTTRDTFRVIGDTLISGNKYFKFYQHGRYSLNPRSDSISYLRDSFGYVINHNGKIFFTATDFDRILVSKELPFNSNDTAYAEYTVKDSLINLITPVGFLKCLDFRGDVYINGEKSPTYLHNYYAKDIGPVYQNVFYLSNPTGIYFQRILYEYHLEN